MTKEQEIISRHNNYIARKALGILHTGLHLHHKDDTLRHNDIERYIEWRLEDLVVLRNAEHTRITFTGTTKSEEHKAKIGASNKGKHNHLGENNPNYGKKHPGIGGRPKGSPATIGNRGMHWYNNGEKSIQAFECPEGFVKGRLCQHRGNQPDGARLVDTVERSR